MPDYRVLYYPYFEPKPTWLRSILLFVDGVNRIIPEGVHHEDSRHINELREALSPDPALPISPIRRDLWIEQSDRRRMKQAFELIISRHRAKTQTHPQVIPMKYDLIHQAKIPYEVLELLKKHKLLGEQFTKKAKGYKSKDDGFLLVNKQAGGLIMSYIADRIAKREGIDAITDLKIGFAVNALENQDIPFQAPTGFAEGYLVAAIASCEIPGELRYFSIEAYKELRNSYAGIREAFKSLSSELARANRLDRIDSLTKYQARLESTVKDFVSEYDKYRDSRYAKKIKKWGPMGIGNLVGVVTGLINPIVGVVGKAAQVGFQVIDKKVNKQPLHPAREHAFQMLCDLQKDIIKKSPVKTLLHL